MRNIHQFVTLARIEDRESCGHGCERGGFALFCHGSQRGNEAKYRLGFGVGLRQVDRRSQSGEKCVMRGFLCSGTRDGACFAHRTERTVQSVRNARDA